MPDAAAVAGVAVLPTQPMARAQSDPLVMEQHVISDDMIQAYLSASPAAGTANLHNTVKWRKARQIWSLHRAHQNERFLFLQRIRRTGSGRTKDGRVVFFEKIGELLSIEALYAEFSESEFKDHMAVWAESLMVDAAKQQLEEEDDQIPRLLSRSQSTLSVGKRRAFLGVVGVLDWTGVSTKNLARNLPLLVAGFQLLWQHYPQLFHCVYLI